MVVAKCRLWAPRRIDRKHRRHCRRSRPDEAIAELGITAQVHLKQVTIQEDAEQLAFVGSPTLLIDGRDPVPRGERWLRPHLPGLGPSSSDLVDEAVIRVWSKNHLVKTVTRTRNGKVRADGLHVKTSADHEASSISWHLTGGTTKQSLTCGD